MNKSTRDNEQMPSAGGNVLAIPSAVPRPGDVVAELLRNGAQALLEKASPSPAVSACCAIFRHKSRFSDPDAV